MSCLKRSARRPSQSRWACTHDAENTAGLGDIELLSEVTSRKHPECHVKKEEDDDKSDRGAVCGNEEDESNDTVWVSPHRINGLDSFRLNSPPHDKVDPKSRLELVRVVGVSREDAGRGNKDVAKREPECAVDGKGTATESVTSGPLLDTRDHLSHTTKGEGEADNNIGVGDAANLVVEEREDQSGATETVSRVSTGKTVQDAAAITYERRPRGAGLPNLRWKTGKAGWLVSRGFPPGVMNRETAAPEEYSACCLSSGLEAPLVSDIVGLLWCCRVEQGR